MKEKLLHTICWFAAGFAICLLFWRPWETIVDISGPSITQIKQEVKESVQPAEAKTELFKMQITELRKNNLTLEQKLFASWQENKRLKGAAQNRIISNHIESNEPITDTYSAHQQYTEDLIQAAANSDSLCNEVVNNLHQQIYAGDSIQFYQSIKIAALNKGFDKMVENSLQKDKAIQAINKKLKWQKIQGYGFKAAALAAVVLVIKNNIK